MVSKSVLEDNVLDAKTIGSMNDSSTESGMGTTIVSPKCSCMIIRTHAESLSTDSLEHSRKAAELSVKFDRIEVQSYPIIMGDNPAVSGGIPLTIGWEPFNLVANYSIDNYEKKGGVTRSCDEMIMSSLCRFQLLAKTNSTNDIVKRLQEVGQARKDRYETISHLYNEKNEERKEKLVRAFKNLISGNKKKEKVFLRAWVAKTA